MGALRPWHIIVLVAVMVLLFGAKRLPGAARSLGRSLRIIKAETRGLADGLADDGDADDLAEKADAQAGRRPLPRPTDQESVSGEVPVSGEVVQPSERVGRTTGES